MPLGLHWCQIVLCVAACIALATGLSSAQELPEGLTDHGVAAPVGMPAWGGIVPVQGPDGGNEVFIKLWAGGQTSYLFIDAQTGETEQVVSDYSGVGAYLVHYDPERNTIYDTMANAFLKIDVATREVRQVGEIPDGMALSFALSDEGIVYGGIYPSATVVSYNPTTGEYTSHGALNEEEWPQYLRPLALDDEGWIYGGIGQSLGQVAGMNLETGEIRTYVPQEQRQRGTPTLWRGTDGRVYADTTGWSWHALSGGEAQPVEEPPVGRAPTWGMRFPDGSRIFSQANVDVPNRVLRFLEPDVEEPRIIHYDYESPGLMIYSMVAGPDGRIHGGAGPPLRIWSFDPETGEMRDGGLGNHGGHVNQWVRQGELLYGAVYSSGSLIEYDPEQPYDNSSLLKSANPRHLHGGGDAANLYGRPHALLAHPDGRHVILGGNAARVEIGGGMLIYDTQTGDELVLDRAQLVPDQGVCALAALPDGDLIVGTTTTPATGGASLATAAMIYRLDWETKEVIGRWTISPATAAVRDLVVPEDGLVYGLTSDSRLFVFDPEAEQFVHDASVAEYGGMTGGQAPRVMAIGPDGAIYALFREAIARIEPGIFEHREVVRPGTNISAGITVADGRLYFASGTHLLSYELE